jgi:hypothetical protein
MPAASAALFFSRVDSSLSVMPVEPPKLWLMPIITPGSA